MDPEKNERYSSFYLRRINRKMNWLTGLVFIVAAAKVGTWLMPFVKAVVGLFFKSPSA